MKRMFNKIETMLDSSWEDREKNVKIHFVITLIVAIAICFVSELLPIAVFSAGNFYANVNNFATIFFILYGTKFALFYIFSFVYVFFVEKRSIKTLGFIKKGMLKNYGVGLLLGTALFLATYLINIAFGGLDFPGISENISIDIFYMFIFFVLQGMAEEVVFRGFLQTSIAKSKNHVTAVLVSAAAFSFLHIFNPGAGFLGLLNIFLYGMFFSLLFIKCNNIFIVGGCHSAWNFVMGNVFGINVSGLEFSGTLLKTNVTENMDIFNGGNFGLEGGIIFTAVILVANVLVLLSLRRSSR